jgi:DNA-binding transcriptional regulator YhcF (GntR family)
MLISKNMDNAIRVLLVRKKLTVRDLAKEANISLGIASKIANMLKKTGYVTFKRGQGIYVTNWVRLLKAWSYTSSLKELETMEFIAAERPQYLIKKIASIAQKNNLQYAFTLLSATELIAPYVSPNETHLYILEPEKKKWELALRKENIFPAERGNVICFLVDEARLYGSFNIRGINIISFPQLYADLFSVGGRLEESAEELLKIIKESDENV